jgi:6-phosphogluconolactonase
MNAPVELQGLHGELVVEPTPEATAQRLATDLILWLQQRIAQAGTAHLALSGGSSPQGLYHLLAMDGRYSADHWAHTHLWMVDERCVADDDPRLNFAMIRTELATKVPLPAAQIHPMPVGLPDGDYRYEAELRAALSKASGDRLDAAILGMGPDCHTASLFPSSPALDEHQRWVRFNDGETVVAPRPRMTMTFPVLCAARFVAVLVTGENKHAALHAAAIAPDDLHGHPITGIRQAGDSRLVWYLDRAAVEGSG